MKKSNIKLSAQRLIIIVCLIFAAIALTVLLCLITNSTDSASEQSTEANNNKYTSAPVLYPPDNPKSLEFKTVGEGTCVISGIGRYSGSDLKLPEKSPLGESVIGIDKLAFENCSQLISVEIPPSITKIGERAFKGCSSLVLIEVDYNNQSFASVGGILYSKDKTRLICCPSARIGSSYVINPNVKSIADYAFYDMQNLTKIYYSGSTADFERISIGQGNEDFTSLPITCNYISGK